MKIRGKSAFKLCPICHRLFEYEISRGTLYCGYKCSSLARPSPPKINVGCVFIEKARVIHKDRYDYSLAQANGSNTKVKIICAKHGVFEQTAGGHLLGKGCKKCANENLFKTISEFIAEARAIHGAKYDYSLVDYKGYHDRVTIICPTHGSFTQTPSQHISRFHRAGCSECVKIIRISKAEKQWLDYCGVPDDNAHRQVRIQIDDKKYFIVDGIAADSKTIYEFLGDYWHGNPAKYLSHLVNASCKKTFGKLFEETNQRIKTLEDLGYIVDHVWESIWQKSD